MSLRQLVEECLLLPSLFPILIWFWSWKWGKPYNLSHFHIYRILRYNANFDFKFSCLCFQSYATFQWIQQIVVFNLISVDLVLSYWILSNFVNASESILWFLIHPFIWINGKFCRFFNWWPCLSAISFPYPTHISPISYPILTFLVQCLLFSPFLNIWESKLLEEIKNQKKLSKKLILLLPI